MGPTGFEPVTSRLSAGCSNQLSYGPSEGFCPMRKSGLNTFLGWNKLGLIPSESA